MEPAANAIRTPIADPFGLKNRDANNGSNRASVSNGSGVSEAPPGGFPNAQRLNANQRRSSQSTPITSAPSTSGPALLGTPAGAGDDAERYSAPPAQLAKRDAGRAVAIAPPTDSQEPDQLAFDPFAQPANPLPSSGKADSNASSNSYTLPTTNTAINGGPSLETVANVEGTGQPGGRQIEGLQSPQVTIQKSVPNEIQVGKPAIFRVTVRNVGQTPAGEVEVRDQIPKGTKLMTTTPRASRNGRGELVWTLGTLRPGEESIVEMQLMPTAEGEVGSVATVHFGADATARCIATRPQLVIETSLPKQVMIGDQATLSVTVSNPGTGVATGVVLEERIPPGMQHPAGNELEYTIGDLKPGESRKVDLPLTAHRPGPAVNLVSVRGDGNLHAEDKCNVEVVAPQLDVVMEGPKKRYLERQATYQLSVSNPGTAAAQQVELVAYLPSNLKFVNANNAGYYDEASRTVRWRLEELPANEKGSVELVTMPVEAGQQAIKFRGTAQRGLTVEKEQPVIIEGIAAIVFQVSSTANPIEVGGETIYEAHIENRGSKTSNNIRLTVELPPQLKPIAVDAPMRDNRLDNGRIVFGNLARLAPKTNATFQIKVKGVQPGDLRTRFVLQTDEMQLPVTKEEPTRVYADE
jgi:uncharacterized repeat protein (TIGR01451 family)